MAGDVVIGQTLWLGITKYAAPVLLTIAIGGLGWMMADLRLTKAALEASRGDYKMALDTLESERGAVKDLTAQLAVVNESLAVLNALENQQASEAAVLARRALARTNEIERKVDALPTSREPVLTGGNSVFGLVHDGRADAFASAGLGQTGDGNPATGVPPVAKPDRANQRPANPDPADRAGLAPQSIISERPDRSGAMAGQREPGGRDVGGDASGAGDKLAGGVAKTARVSQPCTASDSYGLSACLDQLFVWVIESHVSSDDGAVWLVDENAVTEIHPLASFRNQSECQKRGVEMATDVTRQARRDGLRDEVLTRHTTLCGPVWTEYAKGGESPFRDQWPDISNGFIPRELEGI